MNQNIANELEKLWSDFDKNPVKNKLEAFYRLKKASMKQDLPQLIDALKSERNDFWTRELLSDPISDLGGIEYLSELFDALQKNEDEGHDNDSFCNNLIEITRAEPTACKERLFGLINVIDFKHKAKAEWLLEFCELDQHDRLGSME